MILTRRRALFGGAALAAAGVAGATTVIGSGSEVLSSGRSRARALRTAPGAPKEADVVIVGGGNNGAAIAYYLAKAGQKVVLCEKGAIAGEASGRSVGHVMGLGGEPTKMPIIAEAKRLWRGVNADLGIECGFRENGLVMEIKSEEERAFWEVWLKQNAEHAPQARLLDRNQVGAMLPLNTPWLGAIYDPTDGSAEPTLVAPAFAEAAQRLGASIVAPCAVRGIEREGGRVSGVVTEHGPIKARTVVIATGAWSEAFLHNMGLSLPLGNVFQWCTTIGAAGAPARNAIFRASTWRRQIDGNYTISLRDSNAPITPASFRYLPQMAEMLFTASGKWPVRPRLGKYFFEELLAPSTWAMDEISPFERRRILEPEANDGYIERMIDEARAVSPAFAKLKPGKPWGGVISSLPDGMPVLGPLPGNPGVVMAVAMPEGLTTAPAVGKMIADLIDGGPERFALKPFDYARLD